MATMNVSLPAPMREWIEDQIKTGRYAKASDYVRDLIRRDQEAKEALIAAQAGAASGKSRRTSATRGRRQWLAPEMGEDQPRMLC